MLIEFKKNFKLNWDIVITKIPIKKIFNLCNFEKYFDLGSIIKLAATREIIRV